MKTTEKSNWQTCETRVFWGEIAPTDHVVQIYENDEAFLNLLEGFVNTGLEANESVLLIATPTHLSALENRLKDLGHDIPQLCNNNQLLLLDAEETLSKFMVNGWPNSRLFDQTVSEIIKRASNDGRHVRVFGEMVALLAAKGQDAATVHLENLWNRFCNTQSFCLLCAYPKAGFTQDIHSSLESICCAHSKMISGEHQSKTKVFYKMVDQKA